MFQDYSNHLSLDLELTEDCNFACKYCIERGYFTPNIMSEDVYKNIVKKINYILNKTDYANHINIGLWGGEPTLNRKAIEYITGKFIGDQRISYHIFTNGLIIDQYYNLINDVQNSGQQFQIQLSYDGLAIHNANRVDRCGKLTGEKTRARLIELIENPIINSHIKSTITFDDLDKIYESYLDLCDIYDTYCIPNNKPQAVSYTPTIDYSLISYKNKLTEENMPKLLKVFEEQMILIAKNEYSRVLDHKPILFTWFDDFTSNISHNKGKKCSAGYRYKAINYNGELLTCHGCFFTKDINDHYICNVNDKNSEFVNKLRASDLRFSIVYDYKNDLMPQTCQQCDALICYICNAIKYTISNKKLYVDRWWDCANQPKLCKFYKIASNVFRALHMKYKVNSVRGE